LITDPCFKRSSSFSEERIAPLWVDLNYFNDHRDVMARNITYKSVIVQCHATTVEVGHLHSIDLYFFCGPIN